MAIPTLKMRHANAKQYKDLIDKEGLWFALGRTSPWIDENKPPDPDNTASSVEEVIGYKKAALVTFVRKDPDAGTIIYLGERYTPITDADAASENAILILIKALIEYTELPATTTRQLGIFHGLQRAASVSADAVALTPSQVSDPGVLDIIDNTIPNTRAEYQRDEYSYMLQF